MTAKTKYIPALHWKQLTPLYDPLLRWVMQEEHFKRALIRQANVQPGYHVLDLGCGTATLTIMVKQSHPDAQIIGLDGDLAALQIGKEKAEKEAVDLELEHGMAYALPYPDGSFDRILSSLMFHHLTRADKQRTMREVYRALVVGGSFLIVDFGRPRGLWSRLISPLMARLEEVSDNHKGLLSDMMRRAGFTSIEEIAFFNTIFGTLYLLEGRKGLLTEDTQ